MNNTNPHREGLVQNYGPRRARQRRELNRLISSVRHVLWRKPGRLVLWVERDLAQAKANGRKWWSVATLDAPYRGKVYGMGHRAILVLDGRAPA